jgi:hypothetical protein
MKPITHPKSTAVNFNRYLGIVRLRVPSRRLDPGRGHKYPLLHLSHDGAKICSRKKKEVDA